MHNERPRSFCWTLGYPVTSQSSLYCCLCVPTQELAWYCRPGICPWFRTCINCKDSLSFHAHPQIHLRNNIGKFVTLSQIHQLFKRNWKFLNCAKAGEPACSDLIEISTNLLVTKTVVAVANPRVIILNGEIDMEFSNAVVGWRDSFEPQSLWETRDVGMATSALFVNISNFWWNRITYGIPTLCTTRRTWPDSILGLWRKPA